MTDIETMTFSEWAAATFPPRFIVDANAYYVLMRRHARIVSALARSRYYSTAKARRMALKNLIEAIKERCDVQYDQEATR